MYAVLLTIHILAAFLLIVVILIQRGRGGGLVESFSSVESMFGTKTSQFLTRATAGLAITFLITSILLALMAARMSRSLISERAVSLPAPEGRALEEAVPLEPGAVAESPEVPLEPEAAAPKAAAPEALPLPNQQLKEQAPSAEDVSQ